MVGSLVGVASAWAHVIASVPVTVICNAPVSARAGDVVGLQGEHFGDAPVVVMAGYIGKPSVELPIVNKFGTGWVSARIPETAQGALTVQVGNGAVFSAPVKLNAAQPLHLDTTEITPGGSFRIFGRNLVLPGFAASVVVNGASAVVDLAASDEHMLVVTAPAGLSSQATASISVDNGNGSGASSLDRHVTVTPAMVANANADPFSLGVGWASGFSKIALRVVNAATDHSLKQKVSCDAVTDNTVAIQAAVDQLAASAGGVLQLPAGTCRLTGSVTLKSAVILQGVGKDQTVLRYEGHYPLFGNGLVLSSVRELTLASVGGRIESPLLQHSTRVFFQNVKFDLNGGLQMVLTDNRDFVVMGSDFNQPKNPDDFGPYHFAGTSGLVFVNNTTFANGSPTFARVHDAYITNSRFTRDARNNQDSKGAIHSLAMDFAHRIAIVGNTFDVLGGPIVNKSRKDGETVLTEGGGGNRTENLG